MLLQYIIPILAGFSVIMLGAAWIVYRQSRRAPLQARLRAIEGGAVAMGGSPQAAPFAGVLERVGRSVAPQQSSSLKQELAAAGFHSRAAPTVYLGAKIMLFFVAVPLCFFLVMMLDIPNNLRYLLMLCAAMVLFFLPNLYIIRCRERRRLDVQSHLPDAIDLLEIAVSAGQGLDQAWNSVASEVRNVSPTLADEMALTNLEIQLGASRAIAMRHMAVRTNSADLSSLVAVLVQSDRFGTSIAEALRTFATSMREQRSMRAQEYAEKMAVKLIFPMVLFIFPAVVIVMAGPGFMSLVTALKVSH